MSSRYEEQTAFSARLRVLLDASQVSASAAELARLLPRFGGAPVSQQAISGWLNGRAMPRQSNMRALAKMLGVDPLFLQFGEGARGVREPHGRVSEHPLDVQAMDQYLHLPARYRAMVRELIDALSRVPPEAAERLHDRR